jgi:hypothetical protein
MRSADAIKIGISSTRSVVTASSWVMPIAYRIFQIRSKFERTDRYYVPTGKGLEQKIKKGFRVYHLIGKSYGIEKKNISTSELIAHPIAALHFSTLTQNILKISENSQSSLLQKVAKVLIEN